jgi:hypothetical protein
MTPRLSTRGHGHHVNNADFFNLSSAENINEFIVKSPVATSEAILMEDL